MKASEVRQLALLLHSLVEEDYSDVPEALLSDSEVVSLYTELIESIENAVVYACNHSIEFSDAGLSTALKRKALRKKFVDDGYRFITTDSRLRILSWASVDPHEVPWIASPEESPYPDRPQVAPESKIIVKVQNSFATAEVEKRDFAANVSEDGSVLSVDALSGEKTLMVT